MDRQTPKGASGVWKYRGGVREVFFGFFEGVFGVASGSRYAGRWLDAEGAEPGIDFGNVALAFSKPFGRPEFQVPVVGSALVVARAADVTPTEGPGAVSREVEQWLLLPARIATAGRRGGFGHGYLSGVGGRPG